MTKQILLSRPKSKFRVNGKIEYLIPSEMVYTTVDDLIYEYLNKWTWNAQYSWSTYSFYISRSSEYRRVNMSNTVWSYYHKPIPEGLMVDHISGNTLDNTISNLRVVTPRLNACNKRIRRNDKTKSKYPGVCYDNSRKRNNWYAQVTVKGKQFIVKYRDNEKDAFEDYLNEVRKLGEPATFDEMEQWLKNNNLW